MQKLITYFCNSFPSALAGGLAVCSLFPCTPLYFFLTFIFDFKHSIFTRIVQPWDIYSTYLVSHSFFSSTFYFRSLHEAYNCFRSATLDCETRKLKNLSAIHSLQMRYQRIRLTIERYCRRQERNIITATTTAAIQRCRNISPCLDEIYPLEEFMTNGALDETGCR